MISYIALGKWQDIRDTGAGEMDGAGSGSILFATGSAAITQDTIFSLLSEKVEALALRVLHFFVFQYQHVSLQFARGRAGGFRSFIW